MKAISPLLAVLVICYLVSSPSLVSAAPSLVTVVEPASSLAQASNPANLPPADTSHLLDDVDEEFEQEKLNEWLRSGIIGDQYKWQTNIDFQISTAYTTDEYNRIHEALLTLANVFAGCRTVRLWDQNANPTGDYVYINRGTGCSSPVGRRGGRQVLTLAQGCVSAAAGSGTSVHEMIHAVGFHHEQIRPDRDQFIRILWANIEAGREHNFQTNPLYPQTYGVPYDYYSIMHYQERDFSMNGQKTIEALNGVVVGSRGVVTESDRRKIRAMYSCP